MGYLVLLGAGASFGSGDVTPYPPPLGKDLFPKLEALGGVAANLPQDLKDKFMVNFEDGMADYFIRSRKNIMSFQRELAGYLATFKPGIENNYSKLIRTINPRRVVYSSLNYDLLFESSSLANGYIYDYSNIHKGGFIRLLKIHGSSNFWPNVGKVKFFGANFYGSTRADISAPVTAVSQEEAIIKSATEDSIAPAIAMFAMGKEIRVCPQFIEKQQEMWRASIKTSSKIFIIGVKVHQADGHIWNEIGQSKATVYYFGFPSDMQDFADWTMKHNKRNAYFIESDFSQSIKEIRRLTLF